MVGATFFREERPLCETAEPVCSAQSEGHCYPSGLAGGSCSHSPCLPAYPSSLFLFALLFVVVFVPPASVFIFQPCFFLRGPTILKTFTRDVCPMLFILVFNGGAVRYRPETQRHLWLWRAITHLLFQYGPRIWILKCAGYPHWNICLFRVDSWSVVMLNDPSKSVTLQLGLCRVALYCN